jgi:hypothetical protein
MRTFIVVTFSVIIALLYSGNLMAQASEHWQFAGVFPSDSSAVNSHGLAVDLDGKVWNAPYFSTLRSDGAERINGLYVYYPDGTQATFSPIIGSVTGDTLLRFGPLTGVGRAADGNIYVISHGFRTTASTDGAVVGGSWNQRRSFMHKLNPNTGEAIKIIEVTYMRTETASHGPNRPAVTEDGFVALSFVFPTSPIIILNPGNDYQVVNTITTDKTGFSRTLGISGDGRMVFNPNTEPAEDGGAPGHIQVWHSSEGPSGTYTLTNPLAVGTDPGVMALYPGSDVLFASGSGTGNAPLAGTLTLPNRYYGYSIVPDTYGEVVSYFDWNYGAEHDPYKIPRSMAFSHDGLTAVAASFSNAPGAIQKFNLITPFTEVRNIAKHVTIVLTASDQAGNQFDLRMGTRQDATTGFDAEFDRLAPPPPPDGAFDARLIRDSQALFRDFQPHTEEIIRWHLRVRPATGRAPVTLSWTIPAIPEGSTLQLRDAFDGSFIEVDMLTTSSVELNPSSIEDLQIIYRAPEKSHSFDISVLVEDQKGASQKLEMGTSKSATAGFDSSLDKIAPPPPPDGAFDARIIVGGESFFSEYQPLPEESVSWLLRFRAATGGQPITLNWDLSADDAPGHFRLTDTIDGSFVNLDMREVSSLEVSQSFITELRVTYSISVEVSDVDVTRTYRTGWNLVGLGAQVDHSDFTEVFAGSLAGTLFGFEGSYNSTSVLEHGNGYWLRFGSDTQLTYSGGHLDGVQVNLRTGWNLVSGGSRLVSISGADDPSGVILSGTLFGFEGAYELSADLKPGFGYWIRASAPGTVTFRSGTTVARERMDVLAGFDRIGIFAEDGSIAGRFLFGGILPEGMHSLAYTIPPMAPGGGVDVRMADDRWVVDGPEAEVLVQAGGVSLLRMLVCSAEDAEQEVGWSAWSLGDGCDSDADASTQALRDWYEVEMSTIDGGKTLRRAGSGEVVDLLPGVNRVLVRRLPAEDVLSALPAEFALEQNFPNPFNPSTTIRYALPEAAQVRLEVYTLTGQRVAVLASGEQRAGWHTASFDGSALASGVYIYRLQAGGFVQTRKLMLIK